MNKESRLIFNIKGRTPLWQFWNNGQYWDTIENTWSTLGDKKEAYIYWCNKKLDACKNDPEFKEKKGKLDSFKKWLERAEKNWNIQDELLYQLALGLVSIFWMSNKNFQIDISDENSPYQLVADSTPKKLYLKIEADNKWKTKKHNIFLDKDNRILTKDLSNKHKVPENIAILSIMEKSTWNPDFKWNWIWIWQIPKEYWSKMWEKNNPYINPPKIFNKNNLSDQIEVTIIYLKYLKKATNSPSWANTFAIFANLDPKTAKSKIKQYKENNNKFKSSREIEDNIIDKNGLWLWKIVPVLKEEFVDITWVPNLEFWNCKRFLNQKIALRFAAFAKEYGRTITVTSTLRWARQQKQASKNNPRPVAAIWRSDHHAWVAFDVSSSNANDPKFVKLANKYWFINPIRNDEIHFVDRNYFYNKIPNKYKLAYAIDKTPALG